MKEKVVLGLSGGVDSSASAIKLLDEGYEVIALYINNFDSKQDDDLNYQDALRVANKLQIEFHSVNLVNENKDYVFDYFINEYKNGRTPSPCIMCNKNIKFKAFLDIAFNYNATKIAMGHYARTKTIDGITYLLKGVDEKKDQTYFLAMLTQEQLSHVIFPVGDMVKPDVRKLALEKELVTAKKSESMDICFIGKEKFNDFIQNYIPINKGLMKTLDGKIIGKHNGLQFYTIGQRKGLNIGGLNGYSNDAWFVIGKDLKTNTLLVGQGFYNPYLYSNRAICENYNFNSVIPSEDKEYQAKFRYRAIDKKAKIKILDDKYFEITYEDERAVTPGQACVIYDGDICLGGGIISEVYKDNDRRRY